MFSDNVKKYRKQLNMSKEDFAKLFNVSVYAIDDWESGRKKPRNFEVYEKMADLFRLSLDELVGRNIEKKTDKEVIKILEGYSEEAKKQFIELLQVINDNNNIIKDPEKKYNTLK